MFIVGILEQLLFNYRRRNLTLSEGRDCRFFVNLELELAITDG